MNKETDIVPEESLLIMLDRKSAICMSKNGKYTKHTSHITRKVHLLRNGKKCKIHNIDWCEGGLQLTGIETYNVGENDLNYIMKYIMVSIDNW